MSHSLFPTALFISIGQHHDLLTQLVRRDTFGRYRTSYLGALWAVLTPLAMLLVYTFVFGPVLVARWPSTAGVETTKDFAIVLFAGLLVFNFFAECVTRAPGLIVSNPSYVNKVVFPLEILPVVVMLSALFHLLAGAVLLLLAQAVVSGKFPIHALLLPLVLLPLFLLTLGAMWFLAALGVYVRDIGQFVVMIVTPLMFLSPIFFPIEAVPEGYRWLMQWSPLTVAVEAARDVLVFDRMPNLSSWLIYSGVCIAWMMAGFAWFQYTRKGFGDVL